MMRLRFNEVRQAKGARQGAQPSQQQQLLLLQQQHIATDKSFFARRCSGAKTQQRSQKNRWGWGLNC